MSQVNVDKIQHPLVTTIKPVEVTSGGTNIYVNPTGNASTPNVNVLVKTAANNVTPGGVMLGGATTITQHATRFTPSFLTTGNIFKLHGGTRESIHIVGSAPSGTTNVDAATGTAKLYTASTGNFLFNLRHSASDSLNSRMATGDCIRFCLMVPTTSSSGSVSQTNVQVDGSNVTTEWANQDDPSPGGDTPGAGGPAGYDVFNYTIIKQGNASWYAWATLSHFGQEN